MPSPAKTAGKQWARRALVPIPPAELLDLPPVNIPTSAATLRGFADWAVSPERAVHCQPCYAAGLICLELHPSLWLVEMPASALATLEGFCDWAASSHFPAHGKISYLQNEVLIDMSPEEVETHLKAKEAVTRTIGNLNEELDLGELLPDGALFRNDEIGLATEPDASLILWETSEAGRARFIERTGERGRFMEIHGTPDWTLEIVSRWTVNKDTRRLRLLYHAAGVPEYWLIDALGSEINFQILVRRKDGYIGVRPRQGWYRSPLFGRSFRLERRRNRAGRWQYKLHVREE